MCEISYIRLLPRHMFSTFWLVPFALAVSSSAPFFQVSVFLLAYRSTHHAVAHLHPSDGHE